MPEKNKHFGKGKMDDFKVKKDKKISRKKRRENNDQRNWSVDDVEDLEEEEEKEINIRQKDLKKGKK